MWTVGYGSLVNKLEELPSLGAEVVSFCIWSRAFAFLLLAGHGGEG
jgi:hypothetical protein